MDEEKGEMAEKSLPVVTLCRDFITLALDKFKGESFPLVIPSCLEILKWNILTYDTYENTFEINQNSKTMKGNPISPFAAVG